MFCPSCGSLLVPKNKKLACSCGYYSEQTMTLKMEHAQQNSVLEVKETDGFESLPRVDEECPQCYNGEAYFGTQQTGPSDEPEVIIYRCTKCKHTWRNTNQPY